MGSYFNEIAQKIVPTKQDIFVINRPFFEKNIADNLKCDRQGD
jgi:hypothetical protein